ncbi:f-box containing [Fusarium sporotrichioides]|uniref:F-box containing n=1 Tax=Fusarium sporotrichioides TaxID=5514 RepID=A0A395SSG6_FUSSP|nr:f-box containing [Fusarium sporotrichioides]
MNQPQSLVNRFAGDFRLSLPTIPPQKQQKPECFLLNLPIEVLEFINEHLPLSSRICIRLTCLAMYNSLASPSQSPDLDKRLECLAMICRDRPDCWLAEIRPLVRNVLESDMPKLPKGPPIFENMPQDSRQTYEFERSALMVEHKHVQLAIKYSQLERKTWQQSMYHKLLLQHYKTVFRPDFKAGDLCEAMDICYFECGVSRQSGKSRQWNCIELELLGHVYINSRTQCDTSIFWTARDGL